LLPETFAILIKNPIFNIDSKDILLQSVPIYLILFYQFLVPTPFFSIVISAQARLAFCEKYYRLCL